VLLAVKAGEVATPVLLVVAVTSLPPPVKAPLAPLAGAVNVIVAFDTAFPDESFKVTWRAVGNAVETGAN